MALHPLTPRKPAGLATLAGVAVFFVVTVLGLCLLIELYPPVAWLRAADEPAVADLGFFARLLVALVEEALRPRSLLSATFNLMMLPIRLIEATQWLDIGPSMLIRSGAAVLAGTVIGLTVHEFVARSGLPRPAVRHVRGSMLLAGRTAGDALRSAWSKRFGKTAAGIPLVDGVDMPRPLESEHFLIVGGTGAGKSTILQTVMDGAIRRGDRVLALDVKGDVTARLPTESFALVALDDARGVRWQIGRDIRNREDAMELATELIPETSDPSWSAGARRVLAGLIESLQQTSSGRRRDWNWADLDHLLQQPIEELHFLLMDFDPASATFIDATRDETRKQAMSYYLVLLANVGRTVAACAAMGRSGGPAFSVRGWLSGGKAQVLILRQSQRRPELSAALVRIALKIIADAAADRATAEKPEAVWLVLDELPQIGRTQAVPRLAAIGRSAGVRLVAAIQSPAQLREIYGAEGARALIDNLTTKIVGRVSPGETAAEIAKTWIGERTVEWWEQAGHGSDSKARLERRLRDIPVVDAQSLSDDLGLAQDWRGRPIVRALVVGHGDIPRLEWPVGRWPVRRAGTIDPPQRPRKLVAKLARVKGAPNQ